MEWILQLPVLLFSVVVHEYAHAWASWRWLAGGRPDAVGGRLTLNPLAHIDPFGTVFIPLLCFLVGAPMLGWARSTRAPVQASRGRRADSLKVALAGPAANLALALVSAVLFRAAASLPGVPADLAVTLREFILFAVTVNLLLAFFHLVPVHPLDGAKVLGGLLPERLRGAYLLHVPYGALILLGLVSTKAFGAAMLAPARLMLGAFARAGLLG